METKRGIDLFIQQEIERILAKNNVRSSYPQRLEQELFDLIKRSILKYQQQ